MKPSMLTVVVSALVLIAAPAAHAQMPNTVFLEELTRTELREAVRSEKTAAIVPIGGTEQNGPHMALGKHNVRVKVLAEKIARALGNAVVAPVLAYVPEGSLDPPGGHMRYPGTLTVPDDAFQKVVEYAARSLRLHGFQDVVFLGDHGSTQAGQSRVAARLNREWAATGVRVHAIEDYYRASTSGFGRLLVTRGFRPDEAGGHASLADTSLTLALDPRLVRMDRLRSAAGARGADGVEGDPSRSSAALGELGTELIVTQTVEAIRKAIAQRR